MTRGAAGSSGRAASLCTLRRPARDPGTRRPGGGRGPGRRGAAGAGTAQSPPRLSREPSGGRGGEQHMHTSHDVIFFFAEFLTFVANYFHLVLDSCVRCGVVASRTDDCAREDPNDCHGILCMWPSPTAYIVPRPTVRLRDRSIRSPVNLLTARSVCPMNTTSRPSPKEHQHPTLASASLPSRSSTNPAGRARQGIPELRQLGAGALHDPSRWCSRTPCPGHLSNLHPASSSCEHSPFQRRADPGPTGCEY